MTQDDHKAYLESWAAELISQAQRVRQLIGDAHWLSDGHHKEALLRDFLSRYIPHQLAVTTGFVIAAASGERCSPELDIIIADPVAHTPLFAQSGISVLAPASVVAHLQVKSKFGASQLREALDNIFRAQQVIAGGTDPARIWRGIVFYTEDNSRTPESILQTLRDELTTLLNQAGDLTHRLPTCVFCLTSWIAFPTVDDTGRRITLRWFDAKELSIACAITDLVAAIRQWLGGPRGSRLDDMIGSLHIDAPHFLTFPE